jgi:hypothetical protein
VIRVTAVVWNTTRDDRRNSLPLDNYGACALARSIKKAITLLQMSTTRNSPIDSASSIPLYLQLKQLFLSHIETGLWSLGDRIPGDDELVRRHQVSQTTASCAKSRPR